MRDRYDLAAILIPTVRPAGNLTREIPVTEELQEYKNSIVRETVATELGKALQKNVFGLSNQVVE